jgi:hypothetical protein
MSTISSISTNRLLALLAVGATSLVRISAQTQGAMSAPLAGMFATGAEVRPIEGVPGASVIGEPVALPTAGMRVYLPPLQQWALVGDERGASLGRMPFAGAQPGVVTPIAGAIPAPDLVSFSSNGRNAIVYSAVSGSLQVLTHLDTAAQVAMQFDTSELAVSAAAISDDGSLPVVLARSGAVYLLQADAPPAPLFATGSPAGLVFLPNQAALAIADGAAGTVTILDNLASQPSTRMAIAAPSLAGGGVFVAGSSDGNSVLFAAAGGQAAYRADLTNQTVSSLNMPVMVSRFDRISGNLFLVSANPGEAAWLLLWDGTAMRAGFAQTILRPAEGRTAPAHGSGNGPKE